MHALFRSGNHKLRLTFREARQKPGHQISREERRVRRRGDNESALWSIGYRPFEGGMDAGKGPSMVAYAVPDDGQAECRKAGKVTIGIENELRNLWPEAPDDMRE